MSWVCPYDPSILLDDNINGLSLKNAEESYLLTLIAVDTAKNNRIEVLRALTLPVITTHEIYKDILELRKLKQVYSVLKWHEYTNTSMTMVNLVSEQQLLEYGLYYHECGT